MRNETRLRMFHDVATVARAVGRRNGGKWGTRGHFTLYRSLAVGRIRMHLTVGVHIAPPGNGYPAYRANVGLHPSTGRPGKNGWHPTLLRLDWYRQCEEFLARRRYRGEWYVGPDGRFGDFERRVTTLAALLAELDVLEELHAADWPSARPERRSR
jgi:hypothetical protein